MKPRHGVAFPLRLRDCDVCHLGRRVNTSTGLARFCRRWHNWRLVLSLTNKPAYHAYLPWHPAGYTGNSLPLKIITAFFLGLSLYNAIELIVLAFVTFQHYHGLYFWSLVISAFGIIPYSLGFMIKFFRLFDPNTNVGYVAVVLLTIGWYSMVTGGSATV